MCVCVVGEVRGCGSERLAGNCNFLLDLMTSGTNLPRVVLVFIVFVIVVVSVLTCSLSV